MPPFLVHQYSIVEEIEPRNSENFTTEELEIYVGGKYKVVPLLKGVVVVVNDEENPPESINMDATYYGREAGALDNSQYFNGDVVFCMSTMLP